MKGYEAGRPEGRSRVNQAATGPQSHTGPMDSVLSGSGKSEWRVRHARTVPILTPARSAISLWSTRSTSCNTRPVAASPRAVGLLGIPMPLLVGALGCVDRLLCRFPDLFCVAHVEQYDTVSDNCQALSHSLVEVSQ